MNIYVIYKFDDYDLVRETVEQIQKVIPTSDSIFMFAPDRKPKLWRFHAARKIKESQLVLLFDSLSKDKPGVGKHISWELKKAEKEKKKIVVFKADPDARNRSWYQHDYSEQAPRQSRFKTESMSGAVEFMKKEYGWKIEKELMHKDQEEPLTEAEMQLLIEQYRLMIETSEKLMERRQQTVNLYTTLCTTLIAFIGTSFAFDNFLICAGIAWLSGLILIILCSNWQLSLNAYDLNNSGKFVVINLLEKRLPAEIFDCEYRYNQAKGFRSFSSREKVIPRIFSRLGIILMIISSGYFVYQLLKFLEILPI